MQHLILKVLSVLGGDLSGSINFADLLADKLLEILLQPISWLYLVLILRAYGSVLGYRLYAVIDWIQDLHTTTCPGWINRFPLPKVGPLGLELNLFVPPCHFAIGDVFARGVYDQICRQSQCPICAVVLSEDSNSGKPTM